MKKRTANFFKRWYTLDHITHVDNLDSIIERGLLAHNNPYKKVDISNQDVNARRKTTEPIYDKSMHDYVPLYFNPRNAMLYRNQAEHGNNVIVLGFMPEILLLDKQIIITDGNAASGSTLCSEKIDFLSDLNWNDILSRSWVDDDEVKRKMMAEVLIYKKIIMKYLKAVYCQTKAAEQYVKQNYGVPDDVVIVEREDVFFKKFI